MDYIFGPSWFYGIDSIIDLVSILVSLLISYLSYRTYRYISERKYLHFSIAFFFVAVAFISKILARLPVYSKELHVQTVGLVTVTTQVVEKVSWINQFSISISRFLMLLAFMLLVVVSLKIHDKKIITLLIYFLVISTTFVSQSYIIFHITLLLLLATLFINYRENYLKKRFKNAKLVMNTFLIILISEVFFLFGGFKPYIYVVGEIVQLLGYMLLLFAIIKMLVKK